MPDPTSSPGSAPKPEPLPRGFEPELVRLDERLSALAHRTRTPEGLSARVFEASRDALPHAAELRLAGSGPLPHRRAMPAPAVREARGRWIGRLALAACLGILCLAGWWTARPAIDAGRGEIPAGGGLADAGAPAAESGARARLVLLNDVPWTVADEVEALDREVASLLETGGLSSIEEVRGEIDALFPEWATASIAGE